MDSVNVNIDILQVILVAGATTFLIFFINKYTQAGFKEYIAKRKAYINNTIDKTRLDAEAAEKTLSDIKVQEQDIRQKRATILDRAKEEATSEKTEIIKASKEEARLIIEKANLEITQEKERVQSELSAEMMDLVNAVSAKFIAQNITEEEEMALINQAIGKVNEN